MVQNVAVVGLRYPYGNWDVEEGDADLGNILGVLPEGQILVLVKEDLDLTSFSAVLT